MMEFVQKEAAALRPDGCRVVFNHASSSGVTAPHSSFSLRWQGTSEGRKQAMIVLLVDDQPLFRQMIKDTLVSAFPAITVAEAGDGRTAMDWIGASRPDFIFMDIVLPDKNGLVLTREIKAAYPEVRIVILTNHDSQEHREAAREYGANHFLAKALVSPKDVEDLVRDAGSAQESP